MATSRWTVVWRYLPGRRVKHALPKETHSFTGHGSAALCGVQPMWVGPAEHWCGTGSQREYETAEHLPECRRCASRLIPAEVASDAAS